MSAVQAHLMASLPDARLFRFLPSHEPVPLSPAAHPTSVMRPFNIPESIYQAALDPRVPLTVAALYAVTAKALNRFNASRNKKPWAMSKTRAFFAFVVLHNVFLAVYSAWTFWGMLATMRRSVASPNGPAGLVALADSLCRMHGPPGPGRSIYFNDASGQWDSADAASLAGGLEGGQPRNTEMGRIWNEGLGYYGWIFYLSKFYEVLDTFIILAKGKFGSTLQTYHHAGAMLCMWAGIRYMAAPIWVFTLVNSFIHALMYTYYTVTAFSIRVPLVVKRTLTTMQITQFIGGASYAILHSFISYLVPVTVTKMAATQMDDVPGSAADDAHPTAAAAAAGVLDLLKKFILGSAGSESAVPGGAGQRPSSYVTETTLVAQPCITTANETFAIWLNVLYLAPLTYLFVSFFIASYVKRSSANTNVPGKPNRRLSNVALAEKAGWDAARGLEQEVYGGENMVNGHANGHAHGNANGHVEVLEEAEDEVVPKKTNGRPKRRA
ncbi:hypothetical protein E4U42_001661 [Claviceps africana]|uniref:Elongation of fatty acids protein n=1 Tax=Claviceps africana TaxID=83212 RepID=A0A8K0JF40_9HYPO|nr:hypothetical protein E4U42_001661 [Claviceps africana]